MNTKLKLILGDKQSSSWSMRAAILLQEMGVNYEEIMLGSDWPIIVKNGIGRLFEENDTYGFPNQPASGCCCEISQLADIIGEQRLKSTIAYDMHRVPILFDESKDIVIPDLLSIHEYLIDEKLCENALVPIDIQQKITCKVFSHHIYADFLPLMSNMPYNLSFINAKKANYNYLNSDGKHQIDELLETIYFLLTTYQQTYLFDTFSLADIMIAPLAYTFLKWNVPMREIIKNYFNNILNRPNVLHNFLQAESIYGNKDKYEEGTISWIVNQYRTNPRYRTISHIDSNIYYMFRNQKEFDVFQMVKNEVCLLEISSGLNVSNNQIDELVKFFDPRNMS